MASIDPLNVPAPSAPGGLLAARSGSIPPSVAGHSEAPPRGETRQPAAAEPIPVSVRVLRRLKPLVVGILGSPLHGLLSRDLLVLGYRGRRSGRAMQLPLSYVRVGSRLVLCTRPGVSAWWRNLAGGVEVRVLVAGRWQRATASVLAPGSEAAREGLAAFVTRNPGTGRLLYGIEPGPAGPRPEDVEREAPRSVVVSIELAGA